MNAQPMRVLLLAPTIDPTDVGEARSSFEWAARLSERVDLTVLTYRLRRSPAARDRLPGASVVEWDDLPLVGRFERMNAGLKPGYAAFYLRARRWIRRALRRGQRFDVAHQVGPLAMRYPSPAVGLIDPLVVGPLAGSLGTPPAFASEFSSEPWFVRLRSLDAVRFRRDPWLRRTYRDAAAVLGAAPYVRDILREAGIEPRRFEVVSETGVYTLPDMNATTRSADAGQLRGLYVGRVVRNKGLRDAVRAIGQLQDHLGVTLDAIGDGPDLQACRAEAHRLGVEGRVRFHGRVPRDRVDDFYARADAFIFPSFREPSGNVVFEAMSHALPCVVADRGGPAYTVDESSGIRVAVRAPEQFAADIADALRALAADPTRRASMGRAARSRVESLGDWGRKIDRVVAMYREVAGLDAHAVGARGAAIA